MIELISPIHIGFLLARKQCLVNQAFEENKNRLFYGPEGHKGLDLRTVGQYFWVTEKIRKDRTESEQMGFIWLVAAHDGVVSTNVLWKDKRDGWGVFVTADWEDDIQYQTLYWHIETPWSSLKTFHHRGFMSKFSQRVKTFFEQRKVRQGAIIAIAGNSGYPRMSTGPHLHFELRQRTRVNGKIGPWVPIDPMPHFNDDIRYIQGYYPGATKVVFKNGNQIV